MNEKEVNEYMSKLINTKPVLEDGERIALDGFVKLGEEVEKAKKKLQEMQTEIEKIVSYVQKANGAREAYANLLITAERGRRDMVSKVRETASGSLGDLRKKLGADKLELVDNELNVLETAEG
jgi:DNA anti-recombination protein RmuC